MGYPFYIAIGCEDTARNKEVRDTVEDVFTSFERAATKNADRQVKIPRKYFPPHFADGKYGSMKWYRDEAWHPERGQINLDTVTDLCNSEPWQDPVRGDPHYELMIFDEDAYSAGCNFVFGITHPAMSREGDIYTTKGVKGVWQSLARLDSYDELFGITAHELGHLFGLPTAIDPDTGRVNPNFIQYVGDPRARASIDAGHCHDRNCIMEQVNIDGRMYLPQKVEHLRRNNPDLFCDVDMRALGANVAKLYPARRLGNPRRLGRRNLF